MRRTSVTLKDEEPISLRIVPTTTLLVCSSLLTFPFSNHSILTFATALPGHAQISTDDIIVLDVLKDDIIKVDNGVRTIIYDGSATSNPSTDPSVILDTLTGIAIDDRAAIWVTDSTSDATGSPPTGGLVRVAVATNGSTTATQIAVPSSGGTFVGLITNADGSTIWVMESDGDDDESVPSTNSTDKILAIDASGNKVDISSSVCTGDAIIDEPQDIAVDSNGNLWIINKNGSDLVKIGLDAAGQPQSCAVIDDTLSTSAAGVVAYNNSILTVTSYALFQYNLYQMPEQVP